MKDELPFAEEQPPEEETHSTWLMMAGGLLFIAIGVGLYYYFDHFEQVGGQMRMNVIVLLIYNFLGKQGVLWIISGFGALAFLAGAVGVAMGKDKI